MESFIPFESGFISFEAIMESFMHKLENSIQKEPVVFEMGATQKKLAWKALFHLNLALFHLKLSWKALCTN